MKVTHLAIALAVACLGGACEKQSYSETRAFTHHGGHGGEAQGDHKSGEPGPAKPEEPKSEGQ
ncbi:MAG: hypothetical protein ACKV19_28245 [Verrucomicrobiales bacterium]